MRATGRSSDFFKSLTRGWKTASGREILIRPIHPEDAEIEWQFVHRLSPRSKYQRFLSALKDLTPGMVETFTHIDYDRNMALIATVTENGRETEIAVGRYVLDSDGKGCEFALAVADEWQNQGIGYQILKDLIGAARKKGIETMRGLVFATNHTMVQLVKDLGFRIARCPDDATLIEATKDLKGNGDGVSGTP